MSKLEAYVHWKSIDKRGESSCFLTEFVPVKEVPAGRAGTTKSGYGLRMPTNYMVHVHDRWRRVYCICFSNSGSLFIGKKFDNTCTININRS